MSEKKRSASITKGAIGAGAATALLLGGFGAFALWSDSADLGVEGTIDTGELSVTADASTGTWYLDNPSAGGAATEIDEINDFIITPGDKISYRGVTNVVASVEGSDIRADLTLANDGAVVLGAEVAGDVTVEFVVAGGTEFPTLVGVPGPGEVSSLTAPALDVFIEFDADSDNSTMDKANAIDFSAGLQLVLQQQ